MTATATIEVQYANPPKEGKKQGSIKTKDGAVYGVWPDKLGLLRPGQAYEIEFQERTFNDRTYRTITKCKPAAAAPSAAGIAPARPGPSQELEFVARVLSASIQACAVKFTQEGLTDTVRMLRNVYRDGMR